MCEYLTWLLNGCKGSEIRDLYLYSKCSYLLSYLPSQPPFSDCRSTVTNYAWALQGCCRLSWSTQFLTSPMEPFSQTSLGTFWSSFTCVLLAYGDEVKLLGGSLLFFILCLPYQRKSEETYKGVALELLWSEVGEVSLVTNWMMPDCSVLSVESLPFSRHPMPSSTFLRRHGIASSLFLPVVWTASCHVEVSLSLLFLKSA